MKKFLILGNLNAVTYKEVFPLIKENKLWLGVSKRSMDFIISDNGDTVNVNACWFTNLDHKKRHEEIILYKKYNEEEFPKYDNYDAIEVSKVCDIPMDYDGVMGVPITFLDKYCPEQFEIIGSFNNSSIPEKEAECYVPSNDTITIINGAEKMWNDPVINKQPLYKRIVIRHKKKIEIVGIACGNSWANYPDTLRELGFNPDMKYGGGLGSVILNGKALYTRLFVKLK